MAVDPEILDRLASIAEHEAAAVTRNSQIRMSATSRHDFNDLVSDASDLLRAIPLSRPSDPSEAEAFEQRLRHARHLAGHIKQHRAALRSLADEVCKIDRREWSIKRAMEVESNPAILAMWIAAASSELPLLVRTGVLPSQKEAAQAIVRLASQVRGSRGRPHDVHANFDAAVMLLLRAFGLTSGRIGRDALRVSLSNAALGDQDDAGPGARFVRAAIDLLEPSLSPLLGNQAIAAAVRRIRKTLHG